MGAVMRACVWGLPVLPSLSPRRRALCGPPASQVNPPPRVRRRQSLGTLSPPPGPRHSRHPFPAILWLRPAPRHPQPSHLAPPLRALRPGPWVCIWRYKPIMPHKGPDVMISLPVPPPPSMQAPLLHGIGSFPPISWWLPAAAPTLGADAPARFPQGVFLSGHSPGVGARPAQSRWGHRALPAAKPRWRDAACALTVRAWAAGHLAPRF